MAEHWRSGYYDAMRTLRHPEVLERAGNGDEFTVFDFTCDGDLAAGRETWRPFDTLISGSKSSTTMEQQAKSIEGASDDLR
jgi:hypothetical protein